MLVRWGLLALLYFTYHHQECFPLGRYLLHAGSTENIYEAEPMQQPQLEAKTPKPT